MFIVLGGHTIPAFSVNLQCTVVGQSRVINAVFLLKFNVLRFQSGGELADREQRFYLEGDIYGFVIGGVAYGHLDSGGRSHQKI